MCRMSVPDQRARTHVHALHDPDATVVQTLFRPPNLFGGTENHILRPHSITSGSDCTRARYLPPFSTARCTRTIASADPRQGPILWRMWCDVCGREWGKRPEHAGFGDPDEIRVDHEVKPENPTRPAPEIPEPPKKEHHNRGQRMRGRILFRARGPDASCSIREGASIPCCSTGAVAVGNVADMRSRRGRQHSKTLQPTDDPSLARICPRTSPRGAARVMSTGLNDEGEGRPWSDRHRCVRQGS